MTRPSLGEALLSQGALSADQLRIATAEQRRRSAPLGRVLVQLGFVSESDLCEAQSQSLGQRVIDLDPERIDAAAIALVPATLARRFCLVPVSLDLAASTLSIATTDPGNVAAIDQVRSAVGGATRVEPLLAREADIAACLARHYGAEWPIDDLLAAMAASDEAPQSGAAKPEEGPPVIRLVEALLADAARANASDVHFEPQQGCLRVRYRVDGVLRTARTLDRSRWPAMLVRLKVMGGMNIAETRAPQDGRMSMALGGRQIDFRLAAQPTTHGEALVLRLLDRERGIVALPGLGLAADTQRLVERMLARPEGLLLVTGPTGSGKTTTLYSLVSQVCGEGVNVMTLEDPVEYPLPAVRQTSVNEAVKLDFASGVRSMLRQDPDVMLVGEIRDASTAEMAMRAAMTGHQVFSTLHAPSASGAFPRLRDLGVSGSLLAGNLIGVLAQRLVRRLCPHCKSPAEPSRAERQTLSVPAEAACVIHAPQGCPRCSGIGYRGRTAIVEVLRVDADIEALIGAEAPPRAIQEAASRQGFRSLREDAVRRVLEGDTSLAEITRVLGLAEPPA